MRLSVHHATRFEFDQPSGHSIHDVRLSPKPASGQRVISWRIDGGALHVEVTVPVGAEGVLDLEGLAHEVLLPGTHSRVVSALGLARSELRSRGPSNCLGFHQIGVGMTGVQGRPVRTISLRMLRSFLALASSATFFGLPTLISRR